MDTTGIKINVTDINLEEGKKSDKSSQKLLFIKFLLPLLLLFLAAFGVFHGKFFKPNYSYKNEVTETKGGEIKNAGKYNILSSKDLSTGIKDTIYTNKDNWLELRIDEQMLYQHWRDGHTVKFPISSGNKNGGDPEALESRPGLFAIFIKEEHHISSQFSAANMYHFMPFNQGIGFHSIDGTGYYAHLGVRPSSHGCIRMRHEDASKLYNETPLGTLVLARKGYSARTVSFAPEGFKNERDYSKDEYKKMLSLNLYNLLNGKYYVEERQKFVIDPKIIPVSGVYISYDVKIPEIQIVPRSYISYNEKPDKVYVKAEAEILPEEHSEDLIKLVSYYEEDHEPGKVSEINSTDDLVKKYFNNPIGVLPYFGPKK